MNWLDHGTLTKLAEIVLTDLVLAGDNAVVIALATRSLPPVQRFWGRILGAGGAVGLRVLFVFLITWLTSIPILQLAAGVVLLWVAWKLVRPQEEALEAATRPGHVGTDAATSLWHAVRLIIVADVVMSLDNVIAISGIAKEGSSSPHGEMWLVVFGLLLSIPLVICGSALISKLMSRFRWVIWLGGGVLGHVAGKIIFQDPRVLGWLGIPAKHGMPETEISTLLDASAPWVRIVVHGVPWFFAVALFVLGALWSFRSLPANDAGAVRQK
jgi:YjbE family integral membrane protein